MGFTTFPSSDCDVTQWKNISNGNVIAANPRVRSYYLGTPPPVTVVVAPTPVQMSLCYRFYGVNEGKDAKGKGYSDVVEGVGEGNRDEEGEGKRDEESKRSEEGKAYARMEVIWKLIAIQADRWISAMDVPSVTAAFTFLLGLLYNVFVEIMKSGWFGALYKICLMSCQVFYGSFFGVIWTIDAALEYVRGDLSRLMDAPNLKKVVIPSC